MFSICLCQNLLSNRDPNWTQSCGFLMSGVSRCPRCHPTQKDNEEQLGNKGLISRPYYWRCLADNGSNPLFKPLGEDDMQFSKFLHASYSFCVSSLLIPLPGMPHTPPLPYLVGSCSKYQYNGAVKSYKVVCCLLVV